jgi:hypothetical protein
MIQAYEWASGTIVRGGDFIWGDKDDDELDDVPKYISLREIVHGRYAVRDRNR